VSQDSSARLRRLLFRRVDGARVKIRSSEAAGDAEP